MNHTETLQFESAHALQALYANDPKLLKSLEQGLGVKLTSRDSWMRIDGATGDVERAKRVFDQLEEARRHGITIERSEFRFALRSVVEESGDDLKSLFHSKIHCGAGKGTIVPRNTNQRRYVNEIRQSDVVFGVGPAGTGKTYLAMAMAVEALKREQVSRIILTRPAVEAGEALGFLPGDLHDKISPYLRPLYDALYDMLDAEEIQKYMEKGVVEIAPLAYMRGRTLNRAFIILDEAQNTTAEQMFMFLTRLGSDSKCVITGDQTQIDLPASKRSGLVEALDALPNVAGIEFMFFGEKDVIRHEVVQAIIQAYRDHRGSTEPRTMNRSSETPSHK